MLGVRCKLIHILFGCMNIAVSLTLIGLSVWLHFSDRATLCFKVFEKPSLILGVTLLLFTVNGLVWSLCRVKFILCTCVISMCLLFLGLLCFTVLSILVTNRNMSRALFGRDGDYSRYLGLLCFTVFSILVTNRNVSRALFCWRNM